MEIFYDTSLWTQALVSFKKYTPPPLPYACDCGHIIDSFFGLCLAMVPSSSLRDSYGENTPLCSVLTIVVILVRVLSWGSKYL